MGLKVTKIGLLFSKLYRQRKLGWRTIYLGSNVPFKNIKDVLRNLPNPICMMTMFTNVLGHLK